MSATVCCCIVLIALYFLLFISLLFAEKICPLCSRKYPDTDNYCAYCENEESSAVKLVQVIKTTALKPKLKLTYLGTNEQGYDEYRHEKTGIILIKMPAGEFWLGSPPGEGKDNEYPQHKVYLDEHYIGKYEVTNEQFEQFVLPTCYKIDAEKERTGEKWRYYYSAGREKHPVVLVSWNDAKAYCDWAGLRLPTEAEWEKAARDADQRKYHWGNT